MANKSNGDKCDEEKDGRTRASTPLLRTDTRPLQHSIASVYDESILPDHCDTCYNDDDVCTPLIPKKSGTDENGRSVLCGLFGWRPACLQPLAKVYVFLLLTSLWHLLIDIAAKTLYGQIVSIEREFNIDSSRASWLSTSSSIGGAVSMLLVGHWGQSMNIPLAIGITGILNGLLITAPAFLELSSLYKLPPANSHMDVPLSLGRNHSQDNQFLCKGHNDSFVLETTADVFLLDNSPDSHGHLVFSVLIVSLGVQGILYSFFLVLAVVYVDNNVLDKTKTGLFLVIPSLFTGMKNPLAATVNEYLSGVPVDLSDTKMSPKDPRFVTAWWLGQVMFGGLSILCSMLIILLPKRLVSEKQQQKSLEQAVVSFAEGGENDATPSEAEANQHANVLTRAEDSTQHCINQTSRETRKSDSSKGSDSHANLPTQHSIRVIEKLKALPKRILRLFRNTLFTLYALQLVMKAIPLNGLKTIHVKYMMFEYNIPMATIHEVGGISALLSEVFGKMLGCVISCKIKTRRGYIKLMLSMACLTLPLQMMTVFTGCENQPVVGLAGSNDGYRRHHNNRNSSRCVCDPGLDLLSCGSDKITYLSPCFAGCTDSNETLFFDCDEMQPGNHSNTVHRGICDIGCQANYIIHESLITGDHILFAISAMSRQLLLLRMLAPEDRALGNAAGEFLAYVASLPFPMLFGSLFESMCLVWHSTDKCSLYDRDDIRYLSFTIMMLKSFFLCLIYFAMGYVCRRMDRQLLQERERETCVKGKKDQEGSSGSTRDVEP